jgi:adenosylmethionine-8-amino-7-oxononanoate aminotransferase
MAASAQPVTVNMDPRTRDLWEKDRAHFLHPWTHFDSFKTEGSLVLTEAKGARVFDSQGKSYLDGIGGLWCVNIGYGRREMAEAIFEQALKLPFYNTFVDTTNPPAAELAAKVASLAPGDLKHVFFTTSGSESNDTAVRLIHFYNARRGKPQKRHMIARKDGYHGSTYIAMSLTGKPADRSPLFHYESGFIHHVASPKVYRRPEGMSVEGFCDFLIRDLEAKILELGPDNVAVCRRHDVLMVSDEVVTAFGRVGAMFASKDVFDIQPDIIVCAKGISSGYIPLGATIYSSRIHEVISAPDPDVFFTNGYTYSGHPVACAAGLKNIEILEREDLCGHVREVGPYLEKRLAGLSDLPLVGDVRGKCFMMCVENVADKKTKALLPDEVNIGKRISNHCEARGVLVRPIGHLNVMSPPLTLTKGEIDELVDALAASIKATADDLVRERLWRG